ncbi:7692_t:CDS:2 [Funneliformis mosseae]|uniref:7692_t:CDS:1 n=1 Tax=Funneliformis mosseae TaxID=27381 RepID=A0A9N9A8A2_FUNMO|nr:7692_t:CDS:2 [Funneliformis mosseae]
MTITSMNFVFVLIGIMQAIEVKNVDSKLGELCPELQFDPKIMTYEISFIVVVSLLGIVMGYLSFNLYRRFGWKIYKKYGFDRSMQRLVLPTFYIMYKYKNMGQKFLIFASSAILILVFFFEALAYRSIKKEWKAGMTSFIIFWIFALLNFAGLYYGVINASLTTYWYIGFVVGFGRGLKEYLDKERNEKTPKASGSKYQNI